ncbi:MAG: hypothetical protein ACPGVU_16610 [Limisphaerales bacterium]
MKLSRKSITELRAFVLPILLLGGPSVLAQVDFLNIQARTTTVGDVGQVIDLLHFHETTTSGRPAVLPPRFPRGDIEFDGLEFRLHSMIRLLGMTYAQRGHVHPAKVGGIPVNAKFDELHLVHSGALPEVPGRTIALVRLRYSNGRQHDFPIVYGKHCADWEFRMGYEKESLSDSDTKVFWRDPEYAKNRWKIHHRAWKSVLRNPHPEFHVRSMELISGRTRTSFALYAATIAKTSLDRESTPAVPFPGLARRFGATLRVKICDKDTGEPIAGATITPSLQVQGVSGNGDMIETDSEGYAMLRYPKTETTRLTMWIEKDGYVKRHGLFRQGIPQEQEFDLTPTVTIGGQVLDAMGNPVTGAVVDARLSNLAITDDDGQWVTSAREPSRFLKTIRIILPQRKITTIRPDPELVVQLVARKGVIRLNQP